MKSMEELVKELKELRAKRDKLDNKISAIENLIKDEMTLNNTYEFSGEGWNIKWSTVTSNKFDQNSFQKAHPRLFEQFKKLTESKRLYVK